MNSPRGQIKKAPMSRSTSSGNSPVAKPKMSHHVSDPSATTDNDEGNKKTITIPVRPADLHLPPRSPRFKMKVSTPTSSSASTQQKHNKSQLINILETLGIHHSSLIFSDTATFFKPSAPQLPLNHHATIARTRAVPLRQRSLRPAIQGVFGLLSMVWLCTTIYLFTFVSLPTSSREYDSKTNIDIIDNMILSDKSRTLQQQGTHHDNNGIGTDKSKDTTNTEMSTVSNHDHDHVNLTGIYFPALDENGNPGYVHNATTLHNNPPVFNTSGIQCRPNDATMQLLTQLVYVDLAADERANKLVLEGGGKPRAKIYCHIYTTQKQGPRIQSIRETWGHRCDGFHVASTITDRSIDSVNIPHEGEEEYKNMWQKVRTMWSYVYVNYYDSYDWFHIGGDDMYVLVENLRLYLESEEIVTASNGGKEPLLLGQLFYQHGNRNATYVTGGGGYTLNKAALKMLVASFPNCAPHDVTSVEDVLVTQCLQKGGIEPYRTTDETGAERYNHVPPEIDFNYDPKKNPLFWYSYFSGNKNIGPERVVKRAVSFHLKDSKPTVENMMRRVHAILYGHCANVTLGPPVPTKQWSDGKFLGRYWKPPLLQCELNAKEDEVCICSMVKRGKKEVKVCKKHSNNTSHQMQLEGSKGGSNNKRVYLKRRRRKRTALLLKQRSLAGVPTSHWY